MSQTAKRHCKKSVGLTGYRLHLERLKYAGSKKAVRTIKFPLVSEDKDNWDTFAEFAEKIRSDYENQVGQFNITTLIEQRGKYSLLDVYIDFLRAGAVFHGSAPRMKDYLDTRGDQEIKESMKNKDPKFAELIDFPNFKRKVLLSESIRSKASDKHLKTQFYGDQKKINDLLKESADNEEKLEGETGIFKYEGYCQNRECIEEYTEKIFKGIDCGNGKTKGIKEQKDFWEEEFGAITKSPEQGDDGKEGCSLYFHPDLKWDKNLKEEELIERVRKFSSSRSGEDNSKALLAMESTHNALSFAFNTFLRFLRDDITEAKRVILSVNGDLWKGKEECLEERLQWLSDRVKELKQPKMVKSWADYRTSIGSKLSSWISNTENQEEKIKEVLFSYKREGKGREPPKHIPGHDEHLKKLEDYLNKEEGYQRLKDLTGELLILNGQFKRKIKLGEKLDRDILDIYEKKLANLRSSLNVFIQNQHPASDEGTLKKERKKYGSLFKTLPKLPAFPGKIKKEKMENMWASRNLLESGLKGLSKLRQKTQVDLKLKSFDKIRGDLRLKSFDKREQEEVILRRFDTLRKFYKEATPWAKHIVRSAVLKATEIDLEALKKREVFTAYRRRGSPLEIKCVRTSSEEIYKKLPALIKRLEPDFSKRSLGNIKEHIDAIEIEKIRIGLITSFLDIAVGFKELKQWFKKDDFPGLHRYIDVLGEENENAQSVNSALQEYVFAKLKGALNVLSKKEFIERYVVPPMSSVKKYPLVFDEKNKFWYINTQKSRRVGSETGFRQLREKDISKIDNFDYIGEPRDKLKIQTSKYQLKFLNEASPFFSNRSLLKDFEVKVCDYAFIVEDIYKLDLTKQKPEYKKTNDGTKIYVSIPFEIKAKKELDFKKKLKERKRYLGIDVGEYGLAFSLIESEPSPKVLYSWFEFNPGIRKIREKFKINQKKQKIGLFTQPNIALAGIRKSIINSLKNHIHDIAVRYDAIPSYEYSISNFESGSSRFAVLYKTVKMSDVSSDDSEAEKAARKHTWGSSSYVGTHPSAYGTSYVCTKCWRSVYEVIRRSEGNQDKVVVSFKRLEKDSPYVLFDISGAKVYGYLQGKEMKPIEVEAARKAIKAFARPPLFEMKEAKILRRFKGHPLLSNKNTLGNYGNETKWKEFKFQAGNQGVFICPFKGCEHISDADIQASLIVGLRAWYRYRKKYPLKTEHDFMQELECYKKLRLKPIDLQVPRQSYNDLKSQ